MQAIGIIAEYNPFHNGHAYQLAQARKRTGSDAVVAVMSGPFVQRGEPAIFNKWQRAQTAVHCGVDLVIELPVVFALRSAQYFGTGAVSLLNSLGCIHTLCFGAEDPDIRNLEQAATLLDRPSVIHSLKQRMHQNGTAYATALANFIETQTSLTIGPNNILAIEYLRSLHHLNSTIQILPILRTIAHHSQSTQQEFIAAGAIRQIIRKTGTLASIRQALPPAAFDDLTQYLAQHQSFPALEHLFQPLLTLLRMTPSAVLAEQAEIVEGLQHKIKKAALSTTSWQKFMAMILTKRYPPAKLRRILLYILLQVSAAELKSFDQTGPLYARILAFNNRGRILLKTMQQTSSVPLILKTTRFLSSAALERPLSPLQKMLAIDIRASDLYGLAFPAGYWQVGGADFLHSPCYIPDAPTSPPCF